MGRGARCLCPLEGVLDVIGRRWALPVMAVIGRRGSARFNEILRALPGITSKTLAARLRELEAAGLVERRVYPETPPRVEYMLTREGVEFRKLVEPLIQWAAARSGRDYSGSPCLG